MTEELKQETPEEIRIVEPEQAQPEEKPKRKRPARKKKPAPKPTQNNVADLKTLISMVFTVASLKLGEHWQIEDIEAESIATPLDKVLSNYNISDKVANVSAPIALLGATATIVLPRLIITTQITKTKKLESIRGGKANVNQKSGNTDVDTDVIDTGNSQQDDQNIGDSIKAIQPATSI